MRSEKIRKVVISGVLAGIVVVLGITPLGIIPIPPMALTTMHLPVILGAIIEGPVVGLALGLFFGIFSFFRAMGGATGLMVPLMHDPMALLIVLVLPRLFIGPVAHYAYQGLRRLLKGRQWFPAAGAAIAGTLTNTVGVLGLLYFFYAIRYAGEVGMQIGAVGAIIGGVVLTNGLPEALAAALILSPVERALRAVTGRRKRA